MTKQSAYLLIVSLLMCSSVVFAGGDPPAEPETIPDLVGPLTYGQGRFEIVVQDLGTGESWAQFVGSGTFIGTTFSISYDGCSLLYGVWRQPEILDLQKRTTELITLLEPDDPRSIVSPPVMSPSDNHILYAVYDDAEKRTIMFVYDIASDNNILTMERDEVRERDESSDIDAISWADGNTINYTVDGQVFQVDLENSSISAAPSPSTPRLPVAVPRIAENPSPAGTHIASHFDYVEYRYDTYILITRFNGAELAAINIPIDEQSGLSITHTETGETTIYDLDGQPVNSAVWSPDGNFLFVQTPMLSNDEQTTPGAYLYDAANDTLQPLDFGQVRNTEDGSRSVRWSPDSQWVSFYDGVENEWFAYNVESRDVTPFSDAYNNYSFVLEARFGPVMQYEPGACR